MDNPRPPFFPAGAAAIAGWFRALGAEPRLRLLAELRAGERTVDALAAAAGIGRANASKHLAVLHMAGLVRCRREGLCKYYRLARAEEVDALCAIACAGVERRIRESLAGLVPPPARTRRARSRP